LKRRSGGARPINSLLVIVIVAFVRLILLPHIVIHGRHYRIFPL
jgi:hypothetical protein